MRRLLRAGARPRRADRRGGADRRGARRLPAGRRARARLDDRAALHGADVPDLQDAARPVELAAGQPDPPRARRACRRAARAARAAKRTLAARVRLRGAGRHAALRLRRAGMARRRPVLVLAGVGLAVLLARRWRGAAAPVPALADAEREPARAAARRRARPARVSPATLAVAFGAGALSFATPCVLPLVPAYLAAVGGASVDDLRARRGVGRTLRGVAPFVLGFGVVFVVFGALVGAAGSALDDWRDRGRAGLGHPRRRDGPRARRRACRCRRCPG